MSIEKGLNERRINDKKIETQQWFQRLIQTNEYVGELYSINYETARVIIHDSERKKVGGIPSLSFLIASRIDPKNSTDIDFKSEDAFIYSFKSYGQCTFASRQRTSSF